jgi:hypothetical protein
MDGHGMAVLVGLAVGLGLLLLGRVTDASD